MHFQKLQLYFPATDQFVTMPLKKLKLRPKGCKINQS